MLYLPAPANELSVTSPDVNRPGLILAGRDDYFDPERAQFLGLSEIEFLKTLEPEKLRERWPEFRPYEGKCRFRECLHDREPGCAVQEAADRGLIHTGRLERYRLLLADARDAWRERYD